jgi:cysteine desulfurase
MIYLDNASTTYVYPEVITAINDILTSYWGNPSNLYDFGQESKLVIDKAKEIIANCLYCEPSEIFFTSGSSEGNAWGIAQGIKCLCSPYEHHSITENKKTIVVDEDYLQRTKDVGFITQSYYKETWKNYVYAHMLASNETGEIFDVKPLFDMAHEYRMFTLCDMTQCFGNMKIKVKEYGADMCVFSGHKFHAPKGIGMVYINKDKHDTITPLISGTQQNGLRAGTENIAFIHGLAIAAKKACEEAPAKALLSGQLQECILNRLDASGTPYIINKGKNNLYSTLSIALKNIESEVLQMMLNDKGIYIGVGSGCNNGLFEDNATLKEMKVAPEYIRGPIRFSFSLKNTIEDVTIATDELIKAYNNLIG